MSARSEQMIQSYHRCHILLKNDISLNTICVHMAAQAACCLYEDPAKCRMGNFHFDVYAFGNGMSDDLTHDIAKHHAQVVWLIGDAKRLPWSRTAIWCFRKLFADGQTRARVTRLLPLLTSHKTSLRHRNFISIRTRVHPCRNLTTIATISNLYYPGQRNMTVMVSYLFASDICARFLKQSQ